MTSTPTRVPSAARALAAAAVLGLAAATPTQAALIGLYTFNAGDASDDSGNGNHATANTATFVAGAGPDSDGAFDFASSFIDVPININSSVLPSLTMGAWVNADSLGALDAGKVISHDNGSFDRTLGIDFREGPFTSPPSEYGAFNGSGVAQGGAVSLGAWQFIAVRYDGTVMTLDVDGARRTVVDDTDFDVGLSFTSIGRNPTFGEFFDGLIDNVFFFDEFLSDAQVDAIRSGGTETLLRIASSVPEPSTLLLLGAAVLGMTARRRRPRAM